MTEENSSQHQAEYEQTRAELQRHMEHIFRKAGESPEVKRLRLSILNYRLSQIKKADDDAEPPA